MKLLSAAVRQQRKLGLVLAVQLRKQQAVVPAAAAVRRLLLRWGLMVSVLEEQQLSRSSRMPQLVKPRGQEGLRGRGGGRGWRTLHTMLCWACWCIQVGH